MLIRGIHLIQSRYPKIHRRHHRFRIARPKLNLRSLTNIVFRLLQKIEELLNWLTRNHCGLEQWHTLKGQPVNSPVILIAVGVAKMMLEMPD